MSTGFLHAFVPVALVLLRVAPVGGFALAANGGAAEGDNRAPEVTRVDSSFARFCRQYPLQPVHDYTFLGTEQSEDKPIVAYGGRIDLWFDPADHVAWIRQAVPSGSFDVALADGYLPALQYTYRRPASDDRCEMTAFAADAPPPGAMYLYVRLIEKQGDTVRSTRHFRLRDLADIDAVAFDLEFQKLRRHWIEFFLRGRDFSGGEDSLLNAAKASLIRALITFTGKHPHYGVNSYGQTIHDGFPPTIIALGHCLLDWGQTQSAQEYLSAYFDRFVTATGRFDYYGASLAEYGQMLSLVRRLHDATGNAAGLESVRTKAARIREWLWAEIARSPKSLLAGVPEADTRSQVEVYFHNNAWCWRGLRDIAKVLGTQDAARCEAFRKAILQAIAEVTDRSVDPPFIPSVARKMKPFATMTADNFASYTNYRYWLELLSSGLLPRAEAEAIIQYRIAHGGEAEGMTHFQNHADNWPIADYALGRLALGDVEAVRQILFSHFAGHTTPETWTAYEQVSLTGNPYRKRVADYCVPAQLAGPRLLAAWWNATTGGPLLNVPACSGPVQVDGQLDEACYQTPLLERFGVAGQADEPPSRTKAWLFWQPEKLVVVFECEDSEIIAAPPSANEHDVDSQDRVELFLWSGNTEDRYLCVEIAARGATHDYAARFHRQFDDAWSPAGWEHAARLTPGGYRVEAAIPRAALEEFGFRLQPGTRWRAGLFRADFSSRRAKDDPLWITWVDARGPEPDFHVATSFGNILLGPETK